MQGNSYRRVRPRDIIRCLGVVVLWLNAIVASAASGWGLPEDRFLHVARGQGLSQSHVKAVAKDSLGFVWFGTKNGLVRFDGVSAVRKVCADGDVEGRDISALCTGRDGILWVGTERGLFRYDPQSDTFSYISAETGDGMGMRHWVLNIAEDHEGGIWVVIPSQGVFRLQDNRLSFYRVMPEDELRITPPSHLLVRRDGSVWLSTWGGALYRYVRAIDGFIVHGTDGQQPLYGLKVVMMCDYADGMVLGVHEGRLFHYQPETDRLTDLPCQGLSSTSVRSVASADDVLWIGTYAGVFAWHEGKVKRYLRQPDNPRSLSDNVVCALQPDGRGGLWVGTMGGGADYLPARGMDFSYYTLGDMAEPLRVRNLLPDGTGRVWMATENAGLCAWYAPDGRMERKVLGADSPLVLALTLRGDELLCGTFLYGLYAVNLSDGRVRHYSPSELGIKEESVYTLHVDGHGTLWLGTDRGLYRADGDASWRFRKIEATDDIWVLDMLEARDGTLWLATVGNGLWAYRPDGGTFRRYRSEKGNPCALGSNTVTSVMQDSKGRIWASTDGGGLCRYDAGRDGFVTYSVREGLPDDMVYKVLEDKAGFLWAGTNCGLVRLNPENGDVRVYTEADGLPENRFNHNAAWAGDDGRLYFGTTDGVVAFRPGQEMRVPASASLCMTRLAVNDEERDRVTCAEGRYLPPLYADDIVLGHEESNLTFGVVLPDDAPPASCRYFYRLEPLDNGWVLAADHNHISFAHLPPGDYRFSVKVTGARSGASVERTWHIVILPPWWRTWWAYTLYIIVCVAAVWVAVRTYRRGQERRMRIRQRFFEMAKQKEIYEACMKRMEEKPEAVAVQPLPVETPSPQQGVREVDKEFADRIYQVVDDNLMDESFNVEAMAEILCMSRSTLLRRFRQSFDCSPVELIRMLRLKKAACLIEEGRYRIGDIGYMVGFNSASYFSKKFQKQFGMSPKDYAKRCMQAMEKVDTAEHFNVRNRPTE